MSEKEYRRRIWRNRLTAILEIVMHLRGCPLNWPRCYRCWRLMAVPKEEVDAPTAARCVRCAGAEEITFDFRRRLFSFRTLCT